MNLANKKLVVALSGGIDSVALLHYHQRFNLRAIHINHNLNVNCQKWEKFCQNLCDDLKIDLTVINIKLYAQGNIEKLARDKRYQELFENLKNDEILLTAHHQNDQAETVLLNLFRGSGVLGLGAMPILQETEYLSRKKHYRPFLDKPKQWIKDYTKLHNLVWIEDDSNTNTYFRRNFMRIEVLPMLAKKYNNLPKILSRVAKNQQQSFRLNNDLAQLDINNYQLLNNNLLNAKKLIQLENYRIINILRYHIYNLGYLQPNSKILQQILLLLNAKIDSKSLVCWGEYQLRKYKDLLYFLTNKSYPKKCQLYEKYKNEFGFEIRYRINGQRIKFNNKTHSQSLKKIMQGFNIPPWERDNIRLYYIKNNLIAIEKIGEI